MAGKWQLIFLVVLSIIKSIESVLCVQLTQNRAKQQVMLSYADIMKKKVELNVIADRDRKKPLQHRLTNLWHVRAPIPLPVPSPSPPADWAGLHEAE